MFKARSVVSGQWSVVKFMDGVHDFDAAHLTMNLERVRLCRQDAGNTLRVTSKHR